MEHTEEKYGFEQFLRDSVEDFRMTPARKIWYGIYNQMHPAKKWPSLAISLVILTAIIFVGISNNNKINNSSKKMAASYVNVVSSNTENIVATNNTNTPLPQRKVSINNILNKSIDNIAVTNASVLAKAETSTSESNYSKGNINTKKVASKTNTTVAVAIADNVLENTNYTTNPTTAIEKNNDKIIVAQKDNIETANSLTATHTKANSKLIASLNALVENNITELGETKQVTTKENNDAVKNDIVTKDNDELNILLKEATKTTENEAAKKTLPTNNIITQQEIDNRNLYTPKSKTAMGKLLQKGSLSYYLTPSMGYRTLKQSRVSNTSPSLSIPSIDGIKDVEALNLEFGAVLKYAIKKNLTLKAGLQANYTNYVSKVVDLGHSMQTTIATNSFVASNNVGVSSYKTEEGKDRLNKTTWQVAVPIGAEFKILGNDKIKWNIGATLQPSYILGGSSFVFSADTKNYVSEKSLLRKFNVNTAVETFLSIKTARGITLEVGPQFRYQLFSTYKSNYNYSEKLYNIGLKIGVATTF
jgi:hypothetical protein